MVILLDYQWVEHFGRESTTREWKLQTAGPPVAPEGTPSAKKKNNIIVEQYNIM